MSDEITDHLKILQLTFASEGVQQEQKNHGLKYIYLLLVEMADECRFDLQFEYVTFIIRVHFVVLQTRSVREENIVFDYKSTFWLLATKVVPPRKETYLLCEKEESVVRQPQKGAACQNEFQHMVQFSESDHLLLQINLCAQVVTLPGNILEFRTIT